MVTSSEQERDIRWKVAVTWNCGEEVEYGGHQSADGLPTVDVWSDIDGDLEDMIEGAELALCGSSSWATEGE